MGHGRHHALTDREESYLQVLDEEGCPEQHQPDQNAVKVKGRLLQHSQLKAGDEQNDGGQIAERIQNLTQKFLQDLSHQAHPQYTESIV